MVFSSCYPIFQPLRVDHSSVLYMYFLSYSSAASASRNNTPEHSHSRLAAREISLLLRLYAFHNYRYPQIPGHRITDVSIISPLSVVCLRKGNSYPPKNIYIDILQAYLKRRSRLPKSSIIVTKPARRGMRIATMV